MKNWQLILLAFSMCNWTLAQDVHLENHYKVFENSLIQHNLKSHLTYSIGSGTYRVFEFSTNNGGDPGNHSEAWAYIVFQLPPDVKDFAFNGDEIARQGGAYIQSCYCQDAGVHPISEGTLSGSQQSDGTWKVGLDAHIFGRRTNKKYTLKVDGIFSSAP